MTNAKFHGRPMTPILSTIRGSSGCWNSQMLPVPTSDALPGFFRIYAAAYFVKVFFNLVKRLTPYRKGYISVNLT